MRGVTRTSILAALCVAAIVGGCGAGAEEAYVDTSRLPRIEVTQEVRAHPAGTTFTTPVTVTEAAEATRKLLVAAGWQQYGRIGSANRTIMDFKKGPQAVNVVIMRAPTQGNVTSVHYTAVLLANDLPSTADAAVATRDTPPAPAAAPVAPPALADPDDLAVEEAGGLPVPKRHISSTGSNSGFRNELHAEVPLDLNTVLGFYLRELIKRGWKKEAQGAVFAPDRVVLAFTTPDGPAQLRLDRQERKTVVALSLRKPAAAEKAGMMPRAGQVKLLLGNMTDEEADITIDKRTIKVAAGAGRQSPDGPRIDLPPGKYTYTLKLASRAAQNAEVEVGADETWGLLIGPGGVLPLHLY